MLENVIIELKPEAEKYLSDNTLLMDGKPISQEFTNSACSGDDVIPISLSRMTRNSDNKPIYELAQHIHFNDKKQVIHKCLIIGDPNKGQLIGAWTDEEAQKNYDREFV